MGAVVHASIVRRAQRLRRCTTARPWRGRPNHCAAGRRARPLLGRQVPLVRCGDCASPIHLTTARDVVSPALSRR
ncbi:hypothetical protein XcvCFBP7112P_08870 [Xanthomonas citri pv. vignicola]|nr:hypothetical protein XcvCFBP7112P_08870 [Xanthomonas citri pv. vignicola]